jgi:hypothetical protein
MSFNLLFREANEHFGYNPSAFKQRNTLSYENEDEDEHDEDEDEEADAAAAEGENVGPKGRTVHKKFVVDEPDLHRMMNIVHRINPRKFTGQKEIIVHTQSHIVSKDSEKNEANKSNSNKEIDMIDSIMKPFCIPEVDWQKELDVMLKANSSDDIEDEDEGVDADNSKKTPKNSKNVKETNNHVEIPSFRENSSMSLRLLRPYLLVDHIDNRCYCADSSAANSAKFDPLETLLNPIVEPEVIDLYDNKPTANDVEESNEPVGNALQIPDKMTKMEAKHERMKNVANYVKFDTSLGLTLTHSLMLTHSLTHLLTYSLTYLLTHSLMLTHSLLLTLTHF